MTDENTTSSLGTPAQETPDSCKPGSHPPMGLQNRGLPTYPPLATTTAPGVRPFDHPEELLPPSRILHRRNDSGLIEAVDVLTGKLISIQASYRDLLTDRRNLIEIDTEQGKVWVEEGIGLIPILKRKRILFCQIHADLLCQAIVDQGLSFERACAEVNLTPGVVNNWKRERPEFAAALRMAKQERGEILRDRAVDTALDSIDTKLKVETLKWAAEKDAPEDYGQRTKITGDKNNPIGFIIDTGIRRELPPGGSEEK